MMEIVNLLGFIFGLLIVIVVFYPLYALVKLQDSMNKHHTKMMKLYRDFEERKRLRGEK